MTATTEALLHTALALPNEEVQSFIDSLLAARRPNGRPYGPEWDEVVRQRSAEIDAGTAEMIPHAVVMAELRKRFGGHG